jgi:hypothetical protein
MFALLLAVTAAAPAAPPEPKFTAQDLDAAIQIGYGVAVADVDGDKRPDVLLADKKQFVWYRNPGKRGVAWDKFVLAENLTEHDNVCIAARDIDGDGKCEVAVGAEWNPADTVNSGAVFYLIPPADRTQKWEAVKFPSVEPTTHRMKWVKRSDGKFDLVVVPLHGRGNKNAQGAGVKTLAYRMPANVRGEWKAEVVTDSLHATHNFDVVALPGMSGEVMIVGGREGIEGVHEKDGRWHSELAVDHARYSSAAPGAGEVRFGWLSRGEKPVPFGAAVEPMHGNALVFYRHEPAGGESKNPPRVELATTLADGHALACGDVLGTGGDQIVVGWRGNAKQPRPVGIKLFAPLDEKGEKWRESLIDDNTMACEDLVLADLDGDGRLDIVASGRATKNVKIYWNDR